MEAVTSQAQTPTAIRTDLGAIFISLELSRSTWLITSLSPGNVEKMSKYPVSGGDVPALLDRFAHLQEKVRSRTGSQFPIVTIQEAGPDGFWIDRVLKANGIESYIVDPASIATSRRRRRAKTDRLDGEALVRALMAFKRGEPRVCAMVKAPSPISKMMLKCKSPVPPCEIHCTNSNLQGGGGGNFNSDFAVFIFDHRHSLHRRYKTKGWPANQLLASHSSSRRHSL